LLVGVVWACVLAVWSNPSWIHRKAMPRA